MGGNFPEGGDFNMGEAGWVGIFRVGVFLVPENSNTLVCTNWKRQRISRLFACLNFFKNLRENKITGKFMWLIRQGF